MHCKSCDYPLWNLPPGKCPECGTPFTPSDFEFNLNSVKFMCPGCGQDYYGTGASGHLDPKEFSCVRCGAHLSMDSMSLLPTEGVQEQQTVVEAMPWLDRRKRGVFRAFFGTMGMAMSRPGRMMELTPTDAPVGQAWLYGVASWVVFILLGLSPLALCCLIPAFGGRGMGGGPGLASAAGLAGWIFIAPFIVFGVWGSCTHAILKSTGPTSATLGRTIQSIAYTIGPMVLGGVPLLGPYFMWVVGLVWWCVAAIFAIMAAQKVKWLRATVAVGAPPLVVLALSILLVVWAISSSPAFRSTATFGPGSMSPGATTIFSAFSMRSMYKGGPPPRHIIEMLADRTIRPHQLKMLGSDTDTDMLPAGPVRLGDFVDLGVSSQNAAIEEFMAQFPKGLYAYRYGDYVFFDPGLDMSPANSDLWLFVECRAPETPPSKPGPGQPSADSITIFPRGGAPIVFPGANMPDVYGKYKNFGAALAEQNQLRAARGLPLLPDPTVITHGAPAGDQPK